MAGNTANPRIWTGADVSVGPVGSVGPTDLSTPLDPAFKGLGLLGEDGASESRENDVSEKYAWGGIHYRTTKSKHKRTIKVTCLEDNPAVWGLVNPGSLAEAVVATPGLTKRTVKVPTGADPRSFVFDLQDGDVALRRHIPRGEVTEVGETTLSDSEATAYELTIAIYPDGNGVLYVDLTDDPQALAA